MSTDPVKVKPLFLIKPGAMKPRDLRRVEKHCGVIIAECSEPDSVRLVEPPLDADMDAQARAALTLTRLLINDDGPIHKSFSKGDLIRFFTKVLMEAPQPKTVTKVKR